MRFDSAAEAPINDLLYGSETDRNTEDGREECLNCFAAVAVNTADLADQGCESRAETGLEFAGYVSFVGFTAGCTFTLIKDEVNDRHNNFGEFDVLVAIIRLEIFKAAASAGTGGGIYILRFRG